MESLLTAIILGTGLCCAWAYRPRRPGGEAGAAAKPVRRNVIGNERPWRQVGAAIFLLVSIMFVLGVVLVDIPDYPKAYATFWAVILALVVWLCVLALKDLRYTRDVVADLRARKGLVQSRKTAPRSTSEEPRA